VDAVGIAVGNLKALLYLELTPCKCTKLVSMPTVVGTSLAKLMNITEFYIDLEDCYWFNRAL